jgi:uncharacterized protein (DUF58 family)
VIAPTRRAVWLVAGGAVVALAPLVLGPRAWTFWLAYLGLTVLLVGIDLVLGLPRRRLRVEAAPPALLYIGASDPLRLKLSASGSSVPVRFEVLVEGELLAPVPLTEVVAPAGGAAEVSLPLHALRRGLARVDAVWLRWAGPLGLVARRTRIATDARLPVVPNVRAVRQEAIRLLAHRETLSGLKAERFVGGGSEFDSLREFLPGHDHRALDWKASARHLKLLVREFRAERNHQVVLAFDCGRLMGEPLGGIPKLDHAINAGLLLAFVGLKTGDRVGVFGFDEAVRSYTAPVGGVHAIHRLQGEVAELMYSEAETNFTIGLTWLMARLHRRSLVVVFTDFVDTVTAELMADHLLRMSRRHLVVFVALQDPALQALADAAPRTLGALHEAVVARDFLRERELVLKRLGRSGIHCIDAAAAEIATPLLNRYLEIRRRELV